MNQLLTLVCESIHAFQNERGSLCLCLSTEDDWSLQNVISCFQRSNDLVDKILDYYHPNDDFSKHHLNPNQIKSYKKLENIFEGFLTKATFRKEIENSENLKDCRVEILDVTPLYTHSIIIHLTYILTELALFDEENNPSDVSALSNFINWKERIGRERALGVVGFAMNEFDSVIFARDFNILLSQQKFNQRSFLALASATQKKIFDDIFINDKEIENIHTKMEEDKIPNVKAKHWFDIVTNKMEMMHEIEVELIKLFDNSNLLARNANQSLIKDKDRSLILDFPFFRDLSEATIHELFRLSNIKTHKKGSLLFLEGEPAARIYVIISGWVKIFKSATNGDETVEQMLSTGDLVIETSIFTNDKYFSSAQISNEARLMSFPASIYRSLLNKDLALALNSLKYLSQTSRTYLNQVDNNRLKSSKERVGWFLLKQFVEQKNPNTILLPYEKTIIASLLDMKPETFSRSLKSFKTKGLSSEKHQIQIKDIKVLCHYCDTDLAKHCHFKDKHDCKFKDTKQ